MPSRELPSFERPPIRIAYLSDVNEGLINAYRVVRDEPQALLDALATHKELHDKDYYYEQRNIWNGRRAATQEMYAVARAARFIYLNRTCWNGVWRENRDGHFNVPIGSHKNPDIVNEDKILAARRSLRNVELSCGDFESHLLRNVRSGDFVYFDPPYVPLNATSRFAEYSADGFGMRDQERLKGTCELLDARGAKFMLSNSDTPIVHSLYGAWNVTKVSAARSINSKGNKRGAVTEVIVTNY